MIQKEISKDNKFIEYLIKNLSNAVYNLKSNMREIVSNTSSLDFDNYKKIEVATGFMDIVSFFHHFDYSPEYIYELLNNGSRNEVLEVIASHYYLHMNERKEVYEFFKQAFEYNEKNYQSAIVYVLTNHNIDEGYGRFLENDIENKKLIRARIEENKEIFLDLIEIGKRKGYLRKIDKNLLLTKNEEYTNILSEIGVKEKEVFNIDKLLGLQRNKDIETKMGTYLQTTLDSFYEDNKTFQSFIDKYDEKIIEVQKNTKSSISAFSIFTMIMALKTESFKKEQKELIKNWLDDVVIQEKIKKLSEDQLLEDFKLHPEIYTEEVLNKSYFKKNKSIDELLEQVERHKITGNEMYVYINDDVFNIDNKTSYYEEGNIYKKSLKVLFNLQLSEKDIIPALKHMEKISSDIREKAKTIITDDYLKKIQDNESMKSIVREIDLGIKYLTSNVFNRYINNMLNKDIYNKEAIREIYLNEKNQGLRLDFLYNVKGRNKEDEIIKGLKEYKNIMGKFDDSSLEFKNIQKQDYEYMNNFLNQLIDKKLIIRGSDEFKLLKKIKVINEIVSITNIDTIYSNEKFLFYGENKTDLVTKSGKSSNRTQYDFPLYIEMIMQSPKDVIQKVLTEEFVTKEKAFYKGRKQDSGKDAYHLMSYVLNGSNNKNKLEVIEVLIENPKIYKELCLDDKKTLKLLEASQDKYITNTVKVMKELISIDKGFKKQNKNVEAEDVVKKPRKI